MSRTFTKLFSSITESTVWCEPDRTRLVWICMLAMADQHGRVWGSIPGLANRARVPIDDARVAIDCFLAPDHDSRTKDFEGRRIEVIDGGWKLLNHEKYRAIRDEESIKESKRKYINARRARERVEKSRSVSNTVAAGRANAEADTEAEAIPKRNTARASADALPASALVADGLTEQTAAEWLAHRKRKRCVLTQKAWDGIKAEAAKAGWELEAAICKALERGWQSFDAAFVAQERPANSGSGETAYQRSMREKVASFAPGIAARAPGSRTINAGDVTDVTPRKLG